MQSYTFNISSCGCNCSSSSADGCCANELPNNLYATFTNVSGCAALDGVTETLFNSNPSTNNFWQYAGITGSCSPVTGGGYYCDSGNFSIAFGADNFGSTTLTIESCDPYLATGTITLTHGEEMTCCDGTLTVTITT